MLSFLPGPKTLFLDRYYFHPRVCVCLSVCLCVCVSVFISIISKSSWPILMKLGRMIYNDKRQVPFEDELNRFIRTEVTENPYLYFFWLFPFDDFFRGYFPFFIIREVKCNKLAKKHLRLLNGEGQVCVLLNTLNSSFIFTIHHIKSLLLPYTWVIPKVLHESS